MGENKKLVTITVNGDVYQLGVGNAVGEIAPADTLAETLRERLLLTGTKISCDDGACGCCTVIMNGKAIPSCTVLTIECDGADIRTIEGLQDPNTGELDKVQQAFVDHSAFQCGYCTPGMVMSAKALLDRIENPTEEEIRNNGISNNLCRCTGYVKIVEAIRLAARRMMEAKAGGKKEES